ncbi:MAG TPA: sigma 54-interacting transcriptional regulator, partial [Negativicutes bacterium]
KQLSKETLLKILDNSYDAIFATDSNGVTIYANKACEDYYGIKRSDVIGKDPWQFMEVAGCYPPVAPIMLNNKVRCTVVQASRTGAQMVVTTSPIYDRNGDLEFLVQNCRDVKQLEDTKCDFEKTKQMALLIKQHFIEFSKKDEIPNFTIIANSAQMKELLELAERVAGIDANILILGETGTGKSMMAKYIHKRSLRKDGPIISINCAAIPDELIESELFGYVPGAFTGAHQKGKVGLIELAAEGTLFLDEIAELPLRLQGKILDLIQERRFIPVGGCQVKTVDCRIIAATNRDLKKMAEQGTFREDLYYRLNIIEMEISPLRERPTDTQVLIYYFLNYYNKKYKKEHRITPECRDVLVGYSWPGNVRELEHMMERLVVIVPEPIIDVKHLPKMFSEYLNSSKRTQFSEANELDLAICQLEQKLVMEAMKKYGSSRKIAKALNISQSRAHRLIEKYCNTTDKNS